MKLKLKEQSNVIDTEFLISEDKVKKECKTDQSVRSQNS